VMSRTVLRRFSASAALAIVLLAAAPAGAAAPVSFAPYHAYFVGSSPQSVAIADVTDDGRPDVLVSTYGYSDPDNDFKLFVLPQVPDGTLGTPAKYATDAQYAHMAL